MASPALTPMAVEPGRIAPVAVAIPPAGARTNVVVSAAPTPLAWPALTKVFDVPAIVGWYAVPVPLAWPAGTLDDSDSAGW